VRVKFVPANCLESAPHMGGRGFADQASHQRWCAPFMRFLRCLMLIVINAWRRWQIW